MVEIVYYLNGLMVSGILNYIQLIYNIYTISITKGVTNITMVTRDKGKGSSQYLRRRMISQCPTSLSRDGYAGVAWLPSSSPSSYTPL